MGVYLGIDIGTSGTKTLAINAKGKILGQAMATYPSYHPKPLWSEQDPDDWWNATVKTIRAVVKQAKLKPADVKAIGLSGQMHGSVFLDKQGNVVRRALLWNDQRTAAECEEIEKRAGGRKALIGMVANPALTGFTAPKILWLRNNEPKNFAKVAKVLLPKDDVRRRLTGEFATEVSDASGMLLLDVVKREWSQPLLDKLELDRSLFATCYESEQVTGKLTPEVAKQLGLSTDCVVVGGAGDCAAGAVGNGIVRKGVLSTSIGTSGVVFVHSDTPQVDPEGRLHTFCHAVHGKWHMMGVTLSAGGSLQWFRNALCETTAAVAKKSKVDVYDVLTEEAAVTPPGSEGLFFLPYLAGERTPHADPLARGAFVGLTLKHSRGHMVRSILEGVTYSLRDCLSIIEEQGVAVKQIRASGGGAKSVFWRQLQADALGKSVVQMAADEGPGYGVALLAAVGAGEF
ncbi:MAG: xylulokinase, partial [Pirellulales bacterium]